MTSNRTPRQKNGLTCLHAQLLQAVGTDGRAGLGVTVLQVAGREAVVEHLVVQVARLADARADMGETVELGADLANLGGQDLVVPDHLVLPERAAGRGARDAQREDALAEQRHAVFIDAAEAVDLALLDQAGRVQRDLRGHVVGGAGLVTFAPARRPPFLGDRRAFDPAFGGVGGLDQVQLVHRSATDGGGSDRTGRDCSGLDEAAARFRCRRPAVLSFRGFRFRGLSIESFVDGIAAACLQASDFLLGASSWQPLLIQDYIPYSTTCQRIPTPLPKPNARGLE